MPKSVVEPIVRPAPAPVKTPPDPLTTSPDPLTTSPDPLTTFFAGESQRGRYPRLEESFRTLRSRAASERGSIDLTALFTALGGAVSAVTVFMQTAGIDKLSEGPKAKLKVAAVTVTAALAGVIVGNQIGTVVQDGVEGLAPAPQIQCVNQPLATRSDGVRYTAEGYLQIGEARDQTRDTVMPLPRGIGCELVKTLRVETNVEALPGSQTGACVNLYTTLTDATTKTEEEQLLAAYVTDNIGAVPKKPLVVLPVKDSGDPISCGPTREVLSVAAVPAKQTDGLGFGG